MLASELYKRLDSDFIKEGITDYDWTAKMPNLTPFLTDSFQKTGMGLMCDFSDRIETVYTTVFLSEQALVKLIEEDAKNALLFSHHPVGWDIKNRNGTYGVEPKYLEVLRERKISLYVLHHPLDHYSEYSTGKTFAKVLGIEIEKPAFLSCGAMCGIIGRTDCKTVDELKALYSKAVGHQTSLYRYGDETIENGRVAVCVGGGNDTFVVEEMLSNDIRVLITGVTVNNQFSKEVHHQEQENRINLLGGTHYSSEKYAPMKMCEYFEGLGLQSEFIAGEPDLNDL